MKATYAVTVFWFLLLFFKSVLLTVNEKMFEENVRECFLYIQMY